MEIREPTTMITDYVLAGLGLWWGWALLRRGAGRASPVTWWGVSFLALAVAALAGGTAHGFVVYLGEIGLAVTWKLTLYSIGVTGFAFLVAAALAYLRGVARRLLVGFAVLELALYALWMSVHNAFFFAVLYYVPAMVIVLLLALWAWRLKKSSSGPWVAAGVVVSLLAASIQQTGWVWHRHFNHNDLYHLVQMAGLYLLYRGGLLLDRDAEPAAADSVSAP